MCRRNPGCKEIIATLRAADLAAPMQLRRNQELQRPRKGITKKALSANFNRYLSKQLDYPANRFYSKNILSIIGSKK